MSMKALISASFATAALASASIPALAWTVWPDVDFEWYANVGQPLVVTTIEAMPPARTGYIYTPGHWENRATRQVWVAGRYIKDDYQEQLALYNVPAGTQIATGPMILRDSQGNVIPTNPEAYPVQSAR
jgi:hypothetical protein